MGAHVTRAMRRLSTVQCPARVSRLPNHNLNTVVNNFPSRLRQSHIKNPHKCYNVTVVRTVARLAHWRASQPCKPPIMVGRPSPRGALRQPRHLESPQTGALTRRTGFRISSPRQIEKSERRRASGSSMFFVFGAGLPCPESGCTRHAPKVTQMALRFRFFLLPEPHWSTVFDRTPPQVKVTAT